VRVETWERLSDADRAEVEAEAATLPIPGIDRPVEVVWDA
jgi:hypothetical protein